MGKNNSVKWGRPVENRVGLLVYSSKCGRFIITRKEFSLPYTSVGYVLEGVGVRVPRYARMNDTLTDAKVNAQDLVTVEAEVQS